jgi:hypothetical protein
MRLPLFLFFFTIVSISQAQINLSWETNQAMKGGLFGYEFPLKKNYSIEPIVRFHQNRQYKYFDHREYLKRLHAFSFTQHFGVGLRVNKNFKIQGLSPTFTIGISSNYSRLGSKAMIFIFTGKYRDSANQQDPIVYADYRTFKPMNVIENAITIRAKIPLGKVVYLNYGLGYAGMYYSQIDPTMFDNSLRRKWIFSPSADFGISLFLGKQPHSNQF